MAFFGSCTLRRLYDIVTASNESSSNGRSVASASTKLRFGRSPCRRFPSASMPGEKSAATTSAPLRASAAEDEAVPAPRSRIRSPFLGATARVVAARQSASLPTVITVLVRS